MKNIEKLIRFLKAADAITVDDGPMLSSWETFEPTGENKNHLARFSWTDGECEFFTTVNEQGVSLGEWAGNGSFTCEDIAGELTVIKFYKVEPLIYVAT